MSQQQNYGRLMEQIREAHQAFSKAWTEARAAALKSLSPDKKAPSWDQVWQASGIAYKAAQPLADRRNRLLGQLFNGHLSPLLEGVQNDDPEAAHAVIDFLEVDVLAFGCGYAKEDILHRLKTVSLTDEHHERLRQYGLRLCSEPDHRREIHEAGGLMIRVANREFVDQLRGLIASGNERIKTKSTKMLGVILNGRQDLR